MKTSTIAEVQVSYAPNYRSKEKVTSSIKAAEVLRSVWNDAIEYKESFYILLLNRANMVLGYHLLSMGGGSGTVVDIKMILQIAIKCNAHGVIVSHNHPSGNLQPSREDKHLTQKIKEACKLIDIQLIDHLIVTETGYFSFADELEL